MNTNSFHNSTMNMPYTVFSVVARCDFSLLRVHVLEKRICIYMYMYIASL